MGICSPSALDLLLICRVLGSEEETKKLMERLSSQRHEMDQLQAALQEMGLENQALQVRASISPG